MTGLRENVLGAVLEAASDAMLAVDLRGHIVAANTRCEKLFGYAREALLGRHVEDFIPQHLRAGHVLSRGEYAGAAKARAMNLGLEVCGLRYDGSEVPLDVALTPVETADGPLTVATLRDRTEQHARTRRLAEAGRMESRFLAGISHQFRTPLNAIAGFVDLAYQSQLGPVTPAQRAMLGNVSKGVEQLLRLLDDVIEIAAIDTGNLRPEPKPLQAADVLDDACECQRTAIAHKDIAFRVDFEPFKDIISDRRRIRQVCNLLLSHAIAVNPAGHIITFGLHPEGQERFRIDIRYRERALEDGELEHLFIEFHRPERGATHETPLALPLARRMVELLGGRINALVERDGGTVLRAVLPRKLEAGARTSGA